MRQARGGINVVNQAKATVVRAKLIQGFGPVTPRAESSLQSMMG
jgi:hypothetical protein